MDLLKTAEDALRTVAPLLGSAIGGPLGGSIASTLSTLLLGKPDGTSEELSQAIMTATPEQLLALKKADNDFREHMRQLDIDEQRLAAEGVASARAREIAIKDRMPAILGSFAVVAFFTYIGVATFYPFAQKPNMELVNLAVGWLGGMATAVVQYYFGSSSGSEKKNQILAATQTNNTQRR